MPAALKVESGYLKERILLLPQDNSSFLIGRSLESNLVLYGPDVSERQAFLIRDGDHHRLVPLSTKAATRVGKSILRRARALEEGDRIQIGRHVLVYTRAMERHAIVKGQTPCAACGGTLGDGAAGSSTLKALRLGKDVICPRCVDLRLHADRTLETYKILRKIGSNDEEVTYLAIDKESGERVSVRIMKASRQARPRAFRRFLVRALVGLVLDHQNYLPTLAIRSRNGITYVVLEHLERSTKLERVARERAPLDVRNAIYITNQLAEVLRYGREKQVVVAKRKQSGVLVDKHFWVKVLAYDVTRQLEEQVAGTFAFRDLAERSGVDPDELATRDVEPQGDKQVRLSKLANEFAEVYSVGRILYQLTTGKPFATGTLDVVRNAFELISAGKEVSRGPLANQHSTTIRLLERVLIPRGKDRIRTLQAFTEASKATFLEISR